MNRKQVRAILTNADIDDAEKISQILAIYHDETEGLKTEDDIKAAVDEALKNVPSTAKVEDSEQYKALKKEYDDYKQRIDIVAQLKGSKVKDKFLDDVIAKIKREEKLEEQLPKLKEQYGEYFDEDGAPPPEQKPDKPVFSTDPKNQQQPPEKKPIPKIF